MKLIVVDRFLKFFNLCVKAVVLLCHLGHLLLQECNSIAFFNLIFLQLDDFLSQIDNKNFVLLNFVYHWVCVLFNVFLLFLNGFELLEGELWVGFLDVWWIVLLDGRMCVRLIVFFYCLDEIVKLVELMVHKMILTDFLR